MLKEGRFGYHEAISLIVIIITSKVFFTSPSMVMRISGTSGWYLTIISALTAALMFSFCYAVLKRFPGRNIMEINELVLGKWVGTLLSLLISAFLMVMAAIGLREFTETLKIFVLPESPPSFIMVIFLISVVALSFTGLETMARYAKFMIYILGAGFIMVILLASNRYRIHHLFPILGYGLDKTIINGALRSSFYGEVTLVGIIASSLQGPKEIKRIGLSSLFASGLITSITLLAFSLAFPYTTSQEITAPMYALAVLVDLGGFLQRLDPIFVFLWNFSSFIGDGAMFYCSLMINCYVFRINDRRPIILPMATILFCIALLPKGLSEITTGIVQIIRSWGWIAFFVPYMLVLIVALIRKKKGEYKNA